jgi:predicted  nucleic acid-binding Zn-ribbon protein
MRKAQITKCADGQFEIIRTHTETLDRTALTLRRRQAAAELEAVRIDIDRLQQQQAGLEDEIAQIDAHLAEKPKPQGNSTV